MQIEYELGGKVVHLYPDDGKYITQAADVHIEARFVCPSIGVKAAWKDRWRECTKEEVEAWEIEYWEYAASIGEEYTGIPHFLQ